MHWTRAACSRVPFETLGEGCGIRTRIARARSHLSHEKIKTLRRVWCWLHFPNRSAPAAEEAEPAVELAEGVGGRAEGAVKAGPAGTEGTGGRGGTAGTMAPEGTRGRSSSDRTR